MSQENRPHHNSFVHELTMSFQKFSHAYNYLDMSKLLQGCFLTSRMLTIGSFMKQVSNNTGKQANLSMCSPGCIPTIKIEMLNDVFFKYKHGKKEKTSSKKLLMFVDFKREIF